MTNIQNDDPARKYDEDLAQFCWEAHRALLLAQQHNPALKDNPAWTVLIAASNEQFTEVFARLDF